MQTAQDIRRTTGGYISASPLQDVLGVRAAFGELLARVQSLPFVPADWTANVNAAIDASGGFLWQPAPAIVREAWMLNRSTPLYPDTPAWLAASPGAAEAWNTLTDWWQDRLQPILAGWARDEAELLNAAANDAAFFNGLYAIVRPVATVGDAILEAPAAVADAATKVAGGVVRNLAPILIGVTLLAVALVIFRSKMAGK